MQPSKRDGVFTLVVNAGGIVAAVGFGLLALLVATDIVVRNLALARWPWLNEVTEYLLTLSTFLGAPWVLRHGGHVNIDILLRLMSPAVARVVVRVSYVLGAVICGICAWLAITVLLDSRASGAAVFKNLVFPEWWLMLPMVWCFTLSTIEFVLRIGGEVRPT
ncbi:TRAP transporter small permease subunit [Paracoccus sp. S-4012]|uniref:TRAP transporter small permease n=1 Tax=Paracoccus sp. S-4012 TaxID=2665648 RepID=UPI0012AF4236|nr:TRAP transporter small permease [Paracoccus sp. S-4012]MRX51953.1 TRAP transporter small permease subunit [Paracoccus sp. S-4012]